MILAIIDLQNASSVCSQSGFQSTSSPVSEAQGGRENTWYST